MTRTSKILMIGMLLGAISAWANHPVFVEGNCLFPPYGVSNGGVVPSSGACGDYDGDGRIGQAEDEDGDRVFGTLGAAIAAAGGLGANQNGDVIIVTSGVFAETITITAANGNFTLEAAPGVYANIDAVFQGDPGNGARQAAPGIIVDAPSNRVVLIRNITSRNWTDGILVKGTSRVMLSQVHSDNNRDNGVHVQDSARVTIDNSEITGSGFRSGGVATPSPGNGILFEGTSRGSVSRTLVAGSAATGIKKTSTGTVTLTDVILSDNATDQSGIQ
jgi:hypothetical protein